VDKLATKAKVNTRGWERKVESTKKSVTECRPHWGGRSESRSCEI